jgi:hypothetical protein
MLSERSQAQNSIYYMTPFMKYNIKPAAQWWKELGCCLPFREEEDQTKEASGVFCFFLNLGSSYMDV